MIPTRRSRRLVTLGWVLLCLGYWMAIVVGGQ